MRSILLTILALGAALLAGESPSHADCAPAKMIKATLRNATPDLDAESFAAQPRIYYRVGTRYGRIEDSVDTKNGVHGLMIASEPDMYMINLLNRKGRHLIDKDQPQHFHIPVLAMPGDPAFLTGFELGCELEYIKAQPGTPPPTPVHLDGHLYDSYTASSGDRKIELLVDPSTGKPYSATSLLAGKVVMHVRYEDYAAGLEPDLSLFVPPPGVKFLENK